MQWGVLALLVVLLGYKDWQAGRETEKRVLAEVAAQVSVKTAEHQKEVARLSQAVIDAKATVAAENTRTVEILNAELERFKQRAEKVSQINPTGFGDDFHVKLGRIMCLMEASNDRDAAQLCRSAPREDFIRDVAFTITATQETAEIWQEQCEDGRQDFCRWSITGFTPGFSQSILQYLNNVQLNNLNLANENDALRGLIKGITDERKDD